MAKSVTYTPPPTIREFIKDYTPGKLFFDWVIGPVGSGKTTGIFMKLVYMAGLQAKSPVDGIRRSRAVIVRNTMPQLKDTTITSWNYWFRAGEAGDWNATDKNFTLRFGDVECEVLFRALDTADDVARVLSLEVTFALFDEFVQIDEKIVEALSARCGRYPSAIHGGATNWGMWGSSNPGNEDDWWYEYLGYGITPIPAGVKLFTQPSGFLPTAENVENLPGKAAYYTSLAENHTDHWVKQFIEVEWGYSLVGKPVITTYNAQLHIAKNKITPDPNLPLVIGFDPGIGGSALIFGQMDLNSKLVVTDELVQSGYGAERLIAERLKPLLRMRYSGFEVIIAPDPAAASRTQTNERSVVDVFKRAQFDVRFPGNDDMNNRLPKRIEAIEHFTTRLTSGGAALQISPHCVYLKRALNGGWRFETDRKGKTKPEPEKNASSHPGDAFGYLCRYFQYDVAREAKRKATGYVPSVYHNPYVVGS